MLSTFQEIAELEDKNRELIQSVQELQISRTNIRKDIFQDVFPKSDKYVKVMEGTLLYTAALNRLCDITNPCHEGGHFRQSGFGKGS